MLDRDQLSGLDLALNEGRLLAVHTNEPTRQAQIWLELLTLDAEGVEPDDRVVCIYLEGVSRIVASSRDSRWDDPKAPARPIQLQELADVVHSFGGTPIYGWEFFDPPEQGWLHWRDRLSLDVTFDGPAGSHVIDLFQEQGSERHLDLRLWFDDLWINKRTVGAVPIQEVIAGAKRWWDAMYAGDPKVQHHGIFPAKAPKPTAEKRRRFFRR